MTHWDMLICLCSTYPRASFALQFGDFVPSDRSAANGPFCRTESAAYYQIGHPSRAGQVGSQTTLSSQQKRGRPFALWLGSVRPVSTDCKRS